MAALLGMSRLMLAAIPDLLLDGWAALLLLVAAVLVFVQYRRVSLTEAELLGVAKHTPWHQTQQAFLVGTLAGILGSALLSLAGVGLVEVPGSASALLYLWPVSILLGAINPRLICFAYAATVVSLSSLLFNWPQVDIPSVVGLVAVLHLMEALLIWLNGSACPTPMSITGRHGETVPGFMLQRFWPVPLVLPLFAVSTGAPVEMPSWWPLLEPQGTDAFGWGLVPIVVTMGYSDLAVSAPPVERARQASRTLLAYSLVLLGLAVGAAYWPWLEWVAALCSGLGHELMVVWSGRVQLLGTPYLQRPAKGVGVLDVLPGSLAEAGGLGSGAVIVSVDDMEVHTRKELHEALLAAPAYVRIMFRSGRQLEQCRLPRPDGGIYGFGAILLPEPGDRAVARLRRPEFFRWSRLEKESHPRS